VPVTYGILCNCVNWYRTDVAIEKLCTSMKYMLWFQCKEVLAKQARNHPAGQNLIYRKVGNVMQLLTCTHTTDAHQTHRQLSITHFIQTAESAELKVARTPLVLTCVTQF